MPGEGADLSGFGLPAAVTLRSSARRVVDTFRGVARSGCSDGSGSPRGDRGSITSMGILGALMVLTLGSLVLDEGLAMSDKVQLLYVAQAQTAPAHRRST
jgi:hypothetical protein